MPFLLQFKPYFEIVEKYNLNIIYLTEVFRSVPKKSSHDTENNNGFLLYKYFVCPPFVRYVEKNGRKINFLKENEAC